MSPDTRKPRTDEDGIRFSSNRDRGATSAWALGVILVTAALAVVGLSVARQAPAADVTASDRATRPEHPAKAVRRAPASPAVAPATGPAADRQPAAATGAAADPETRQIEKVAEDGIAGMRAGETKGLAAFPPPGTNPVKAGLVVPNDFQLPEGYIRHYQTTDDGKRLEPILMFSPDYEFVDDAGHPIAVPADGIVPPGMAPKGMPLRSLDVPGAPHPKPNASGDGR